MARNEIVLSIFLASPGDLSDERERTKEVVQRWNRAWSRHLGVRLELLRWEDDAYPDVGEDGQDVINRQVATDWDFFIGLMWSRFGTATGRADSGTQEEFNRAIERYKSYPSEISILFYFKDAPIAPSHVDPAQLQKVLDFKRQVQNKGLLTWEFTDVDQFDKLIDLHLTKHVQEWKKAEGRLTTVSSTPPNEILTTKAGNPNFNEKVDQTDNSDDLGYLDLLEKFIEKATEIQQIGLRLSAAQNDLTDRTNAGREELERLQASPNADAPKKLRASLSRVADEMVKFSSSVESEVPLLRNAFDVSMKMLTQLVAISAELYPEQIVEIRGGVATVLETLPQTSIAIEGFRDATATLPRMTKELNSAKRRQVAVLEALLIEFRNGEVLFKEALDAIDGIRESAALPGNL